MVYKRRFPQKHDPYFLVAWVKLHPFDSGAQTANNRKGAKRIFGTLKRQGYYVRTVKVDGTKRTIDSALSSPKEGPRTRLHPGAMRG